MSRPRVTLVGEMSNGDLHEVFATSSSASRLDSVLPEGWRVDMHRVNLLAKAKEWDAGQARAAARMLLLSWEELRHGGKLILCGSRVAAAFRAYLGKPTKQCEYFSVRAVIANLPGSELMIAPCLVIPHPSGRCRLWNDSHCAWSVKREVKSFLE